MNNELFNILSKAKEIDQQKLLDYASDGGCLIIGPGIPYLDGALHPSSVLGEVIREPGEVAHGRGRILLASGDEQAAILAQHLPTSSIAWDAPDVDVVEQVGEALRLVFVANPTDRAQRVTLSFEAERRLSPVWADAGESTRGTQLTLDLAPYTVQIWEAQCD